MHAQRGKRPVRLGVARAEGQAVLEIAFGSLDQAELLLGQATVEIHGSLARVERDRLVEQFHRQGLLVEPGHHHAERIEHHRVVPGQGERPRRQGPRRFRLAGGQMTTGEVGQYFDLIR